MLKVGQFIIVNTGIKYVRYFKFEGKSLFSFLIRTNKLNCIWTKGHDM